MFVALPANTCQAVRAERNGPIRANGRRRAEAGFAAPIPPLVRWRSVNGRPHRLAVEARLTIYAVTISVAASASKQYTR